MRKVTIRRVEMVYRASVRLVYADGGRSLAQSVDFKPDQYGILRAITAPMFTMLNTRTIVAWEMDGHITPTPFQPTLLRSDSLTLTEFSVWRKP